MGNKKRYFFTTDINCHHREATLYCSLNNKLLKIKIMKNTIMSIAAATLLLAACKKEINGCTDYTAKNYSHVATKDDGSCITEEQSVKEFEYLLTFNSSISESTYTGITSEYQEGDAIITYIQWENAPEAQTWTSLPLTTDFALMHAVIDNSGEITIRTGKPDNNSSSPWYSEKTFLFKSILIKSSFMEKNPDLNYSSYEKVKEKLAS